MRRHLKKRPFDWVLAFRRLRAAVAPYPKAMLFELFEQGYRSPFEILVACILSIRTLDESSLKASLRLFEKARKAGELAAMNEGEIDRLIFDSTFHRQKASSLKRIAQIVEQEHAGQLPCDDETLRALPGVGPKCANLVLGIACGQARLGVDVHVWRVSNRWGIVQAKSPEQALEKLESIVPRSRWVELNALLVPFGKHICTGQRPRCSSCPLLDMCRQVGVENPR
jgi:endonuclease-3